MNLKTLSVELVQLLSVNKFTNTKLPAFPAFIYVS